MLLLTAMPRRITKAKIALLDFGLMKAKMHLGIQVVVENPDNIEQIRKESAPLPSLLLAEIEE